MSGTDTRERAAGFTLTEVLVTVAILALILAGIAGVLEQALKAESATRERNDLTRQARFALDRMANAVSATNLLLVPLAENPNTGWSESVRDPGVLAVTLDPTVDRDADGFADADNDKDGKVDEDVGADASKDGANGVIGLDDDGDGMVDEGGADGSGTYSDDDEDGSFDEDALNGADDDGDGAIGEDPPSDMNADGAPGIALVDDDADGTIDEGNSNDDDEDGANNDDWLDVVAYFLDGTTLKERLPDLNPTSGAVFTERAIADNVASFRVERIPEGAGRAVLVDITLGLAGQHAEVQLHTRVRVGARP